MKKINFILALTIFIFINCIGESKKIYSKDINVNTKIFYGDTIQGIKTLKEFYFKVYGNDTISISSMEDLQRKFVSERLLKRIDSLSEEDNYVLDYDPFIQGQDYLGEVIKKTLKVKPLKNQNEYRVSFFLFDEKNEKEKNIDFLLKKDNNGNFIIYSIINNEYLNFNDPLVNKESN